MWCLLIFISLIVISCCVSFQSSGSRCTDVVTSQRCAETETLSAATVHACVERISMQKMALAVSEKYNKSNLLYHDSIINIPTASQNFRAREVANDFDHIDLNKALAISDQICAGYIFNFNLAFLIRFPVFRPKNTTWRGV